MPEIQSPGDKKNERKKNESGNKNIKPRASFCQIIGEADDQAVCYAQEIEKNDVQNSGYKTEIGCYRFEREWNNQKQKIKIPETGKFFLQKKIKQSVPLDGQRQIRRYLHGMIGLKENFNNKIHCKDIEYYRIKRVDCVFAFPYFQQNFVEKKAKHQQIQSIKSDQKIHEDSKA